MKKKALFCNFFVTHYFFFLRQQSFDIFSQIRQFSSLVSSFSGKCYGSLKECQTFTRCQNATFPWFLFFCTISFPNIDTTQYAENPLKKGQFWGMQAIKSGLLVSSNLCRKQSRNFPI